MGSEEVLGSSAVIMDPTISPCNGSMVQLMDDGEEGENLGVDLLNDLDLYLEDIKDRLTISRMVSDSVIKGMVCAFEQEAAQKIAQKELELTKLKKRLHLTLWQNNRKNELYSDTFVEHDRLQESLGNLKIDVKGQLKKLEKEIHKVKGSCSMERRNSSSEIVGLSGILSEKLPDKYSDVDRMLDGLGTTLDSFYKHAEDMFHIPKSLFFDWQQEREFQAEIEWLVIHNYIRGLQEELEQRLCDQNTQYYSNGSASWLVKELSSLRQELDAITKSLSVPESGQSSFSNGNHDESIITVPENLEAAQLIQDMNKGDFLNYHKSEMTKMKREYESKVTEMKREHESKVQEITEGLFEHKRRVKERNLLYQKEIKLLSSQVSDAAEKMSRHSWTEANLFRMITNLKSSIEDAHIEATISEYLYKLLLKEFMGQIECSSKESDLEHNIMEVIYEIILREVAQNVKPASKLEIEDSDIESIVMQGVLEIVLQDAFKEAEEKLSSLNLKYTNDKEFYCHLR
ncbi:WPP domain-associated protein [Salix suchowensis]|nr:WPP domain-associated protein [Salix suchowensis]